MQTIKTKKIITIVVVLIILLGSYMIFDRKSQIEQNKLIDIDNNALTSTTTPDIKINSNTNTGSYTIEQVPLNEGKVIVPKSPDLNRKVVFGNDLSLTKDVREAINKKIFELQSELLKKKDYYEAWIDLGIYQKMAGDYKGAIETWVYVSKLYPTDYVSLGNLGDLYANFLQDKVISEKYYKQAISRGSKQAYLYTQLSEVYKNKFKNKEKAKDILNQGLKAIPKNPQLLLSLSRI